MSSASSTIYGPCPGCDAWQLEVPCLTHPAVVKEVMREHALKCRGLFVLAADVYGFFPLDTPVWGVHLLSNIDLARTGDGAGGSA